MDVSQYLSVFLDEAKEHLQSLNDNIMTLEQDPENEDCINEIFRSAHSMKGMAGTMGYTRMQNLTHDMEDVFSDVRGGKIKIKSADIDVLLQCLDAIQGYVDNITENQDEGTDEHQNIIKALADIRMVQLAEMAAMLQHLQLRQLQQLMHLQQLLLLMELPTIRLLSLILQLNPLWKKQLLRAKNSTALQCIFRNPVSLRLQEAFLYLKALKKLVR